MKKARRWRYYCDFCKKSGGSAYHMKKHEDSCTNNPNRHCNMCVLMDLVQVPMARLKGIISAYEKRIYAFVSPPFSTEDSDKACIELLNALREETDGCPACIFSALRQAEMWQPGFNFEKERDAFMVRVNKYRQENMVCGVDY